MKKTIINQYGREVVRSIKKTDCRWILTEKAEEVLRNSSFIVCKDMDDDIYYIAYNTQDAPHEIGTVQDLNEYLESLSEEEDNE